MASRSHPSGLLVRDDGEMELNFIGEVWPWRGPSPFHFVTVPQRESDELREVTGLVSYGWGMIPVEARIGGVVFSTSLFPKDETYLLPIKVAVRRKAGITAGDAIAVEMTVQARG